MGWGNATMAPFSAAMTDVSNSFFAFSAEFFGLVA